MCVCVCVHASMMCPWFIHVTVPLVQAALKKELEETKLPSKLQFFENLIAKSTAPEGWMFNKARNAFTIRGSTNHSTVFPVPLLI